MNTAQMTGAPAPIRIGGRELLLSPLTDADLGILEQWIRRRVADAVTQSMDALSVEERQRQLDRLYDRLPGITAWSAEGMAQLATPQGSIKSLWLALRKNHAELTEEWLTAQLGDPQAMLAAIRDQQELEKSQLPKAEPPAKSRPGARGKRRR